MSAIPKERLTGSEKRAQATELIAMGMSVRAAARQLGVSTASIYSWTRDWREREETQGSDVAIMEVVQSQQSRDTITVRLGQVTLTIVSGEE